jgi:hypothetical protein
MGEGWKYSRWGGAASRPRPAPGPLWKSKRSPKLNRFVSIALLILFTQQAVVYGQS